jgi:hypothetical protein
MADVSRAALAVERLLAKSFRSWVLGVDYLLIFNDSTIFRRRVAALRPPRLPRAHERAC